MTDPALTVGACGLGLSVVNTVVGLVVWNRSGPRLRVKVERVERLNRLDDFLRMDIASVGRLAAVVRRIGLVERVQEKDRNGTVRWVDKRSLDLTPNGGLPRNLPPSDYLVHEVTLRELVEAWGPNQALYVAAWAELGDNQRAQSRTVSVKLPVTES